MASQFDKAQALPSQDGGAQPQFQSQLPPEGAASQQQVAQFGGVPQVYPQPGSGPAPPYVSASIGYAPPPGYAPPSAQMQGYMMTAGPGGYAPLPGQPQYPGYPATYGPGPGQGQMPPGTYFQMQGGSAQVVTTQVMPMAQPVQPVNNSLITTSLALSILACVCGFCCACMIPVLCALPALILSSIAMCSGPAFTAAAAERKTSFAKIAIVLSALALITGTVILVVILLGMISTPSQLNTSPSRLENESCSPPSYSSSARDCTWQRDRTYYSSLLSCCCIDGYSYRPGCYIDGLSRTRAMCSKCGPRYSD